MNDFAAEAGTPIFQPPKRSVPPHTTYSSLVESDDDMIGHVAYALYKRDKLKFCDSIREQHHRAPDQTEVQVFIQASGLSTRVTSYRVEAERLLERFSEAMLEVTLQQIEMDNNRELVRQLSAAKSWPRAIGENLVANLLALAVTVALVLLVYGSRIGVVPLIAEVFGYEVTEKADVAPTQEAEPAAPVKPSASEPIGK